MANLSPEEFAGRFTACSRMLWCIAAAILGDRVAAEDVLQDAAVIGLRKLEEFDPDTEFSAWMSQIVRYVALNHSRRRGGGKAVPVDPVQLNETLNGSQPREPAGINGRGELSADQAEFDDRVLAALGTLDETARSCLLLRIVLDMPYREIAQALDVPEGTAMSHVHRARRALARRLAAPAEAERVS